MLIRIWNAGFLLFTPHDNYQVSDEENQHRYLCKRKANQELVDEINSVLEKMTKEDYEQMMNEAISVQPLSE